MTFPWVNLELLTHIISNQQKLQLNSTNFRMEPRPQINNPNTLGQPQTWLLFGSSRFGWAEAGDFKVWHHSSRWTFPLFSASLKWISLDTFYSVVNVELFSETSAWHLVLGKNGQKSTSRESRLQKLESQYPKTWIRLLADSRICCPDPKRTRNLMRTPGSSSQGFPHVHRMSDHHVKVHWTTVVLSAWPSVRVSTLTSYLQTPTCNRYLSMISFQFHMKSMDTQT